jgi:hypothetical protein
MVPLSPITFPWTMKSLASAETSVSELDDGRVRYAIRHELLEGVTPKMIVWFLKHMDGDVELGGQRVPRYRAWHPIDHVRVTYVRKAKDGSNMGPGSAVHIEEFFGADPKNKVNIVDDVERLDEGGFTHGARHFGHDLVRMDYTFSETGKGTLYENALTIGAGSGPLRWLINGPIAGALFPRSKGIAWLKHNVEEVGNFQFFLPRLFGEANR